MSWLQKRVGGLRATVVGSSWLPAAGRTAIGRELNEIINVERVQPQPRRYLLQVLHCTRAFNSFLLETARVHKPGTPEDSIGALLDELANYPP